MAALLEILHIGKPEKRYPKEIRTTIQGFQHLADPVLSGRVISSYLFTEIDGAKNYAVLDQDGNRTDQRLPAQEFLDVAYGFLDNSLGREPGNFHFFLEEIIGNNVVRTATYQGRLFSDVSIRAKHVFVVNKDGSNKRAYVQWYIQRDHLKPRSFIRLPRRTI